MGELYLKPLRSMQSDSRIVVYDVESKDGDTQAPGFTRPFLIGFYDGLHYRAFTASTENLTHSWKRRHNLPGGVVDRFLNFILQPRWSKYKIFAHNGGKFDHLFILKWLVARRDKYAFRIASVQGKIQKLDVWRRNDPQVVWSFHDSLSLVPLSLAEMGATFVSDGQQKDTLPLETPESATRLWQKYNRIDCEVLYTSIQAFCALVKKLGGSVGITAPATSMKVFRSAYQREWISIHAHLPDCDRTCHGCVRYSCDRQCHGCAHEFVRKGYYGGRTELFEEYGFRISYFDINSSYPASMRDPMPIGDMEVIDNPTERELVSLARGRVGFVEATVDIPKSCKIPPLPLRKDGKLIFPTGAFSGVWDWEELKLIYHGRVRGKIRSIGRTVWYEAKAIFRDMVADLYAYRDINRPDYDKGLAFIAKLLLNSLYGKFAMDPVRTGLELVASFQDPPRDGWPIDGKFDCPIWECERICEAPYIVPQISAHITALSRIRLFLGMMEVVSKKGRVFYVDTDSIFCNVELETGPLLGQWKKEKPGIALEGHFVLPKLYQYLFHKLGCKSKRCKGCAPQIAKRKDGTEYEKLSEERMKGVSGGAQTAENFVRMIDGETLKFNRLMMHKTLLKSNVSGPRVVNASKSMRTVYDKRVLLVGGTTRPIHLEG